MMYGLIDKGVVAVVVEWDGVSKHIDAERLVKLPGNRLASEWIGVKKEDIAAFEPPKAVAPNPYPAPGPANRPAPHERVQDPSPTRPVPVPSAAAKPNPGVPSAQPSPDPRTVRIVEKK